MHFSLPILLLFILSACSTAPTEEQGTTAPVEPVTEAPVDWPGYYEDTLPCADCDGIYTQIWLRGDGTFVRRACYLGHDSVAFGTIGSWKLANGLLLLARSGGKPDHFRYEAQGLRMVDAAGRPFDPGHPCSLEKLAGEIGDAIPRMRLKGTFTYMADAQSFQPCGATYSWPCVGGMDMGEEEGEPLVKFTNMDLQQAYAKAVKNGGDPWLVEVICTMGMGPAMEGDGADEYIFIEQVIGTASDGCP